VNVIMARGDGRGGEREGRKRARDEAGRYDDAGGGQLKGGQRGAAQVPARAPSGQPALRVPLAESHPDRILAACDGVIDLAAMLFGVSGKELRSPSRSTLAVSRVRQIAMYAAHVTLGFTMGHVGQGFGRDRTTVLHACHQIEDMREDAEFDRIVARVEQVVAAAFGLQAERG
jgi:hypothetical protein